MAGLAHWSLIKNQVSIAAGSVIVEGDSQTRDLIKASRILKGTLMKFQVES